MSGEWAWFAEVETPPDDAWAMAQWTSADGASEGWLAAWPQGRKPRRDAVRMDGRIVDPEGEACWVSLVLLEPGREPLFDDPAVSGALRDVLAGPPADCVTTFVRNSTHFPGGLTVRRGSLPDWSSDPFARLGPARRLRVAAGLFGKVAPPAGPVIQRYSGQPWPMAGF